MKKEIKEKEIKEKKKKKKDKDTEKTSNDVPAQEKVRRFPRFGILDVAIILLVISVVVGLAFRYNLFSTFTKMQNLEEYAVEFSVKNIENSTQNFIENGDSVYFKDTGKTLGTIMESSDASSIPLIVSPSTQTFINEGKAITVQYPKETRIDAIGRIKADGKLSDDGTFLLNGSDYLSPGQTFVVCTEKVTLEITVTSITAITK